MKKINKEIGHLNPLDHIKIVTIIDGDKADQKAIFKRNEPYKVEGDEAFFNSFKEEVQGIIKTQFVQKEDFSYFVEVLYPDNKAIVFGAGHVSLPVVSLLKELDFHVTVLDDREGFDELAYGAGADKVIIGDFEKTAPAIKTDDNTYLIIVTRGHSSDEVCLKAVINKPFGYLGMIGSHHRIHHYHKRFLQEGYSEEQWNTIHTPIGLQIKAMTPFEIAISILGEIIEVKNTKISEMGYTSDIMNALKDKTEEDLVMATVMTVKGTGPRGVGAKMLIDSKGDFVGTVGGGVMEKQVLEKAKEILETGESYVHCYDATNIAEWDTSGVCGGIVKIYMEKF